MHLGLVRHEGDEQAGQPDGLGAQVGAHELAPGRRAVALVEDQVDDAEHGTQPVRELGLARDAVGDVGGADLALGPHEALRHRRFGDEERPGDLLGLEAAEEAERERRLGARGQRRVAAGEDQPEAVVLHRSSFRPRRVVVALGEEVGLVLAALAGRFPPEPVDGPVAGGRDDPATGVGRRALLGPGSDGDGERFLDRLFGEVDVTEEADQGGDGTAELLPEDRLDVGQR